MQIFRACIVLKEFHIKFNIVILRNVYYIDVDQNSDGLCCVFNTLILSTVHKEF